MALDLSSPKSDKTAHKKRNTPNKKLLVSATGVYFSEMGLDRSLNVILFYKNDFQYNSFLSPSFCIVAVVGLALPAFNMAIKNLW